MSLTLSIDSFVHKFITLMFSKNYHVFFYLKTSFPFFEKVFMCFFDIFGIILFFKPNNLQNALFCLNKLKKHYF